MAINWYDEHRERSEEPRLRQGSAGPLAREVERCALAGVDVRDNQYTHCAFENVSASIIARKKTRLRVYAQPVC